MSWFELLEAQPGKITKVSPDGKKLSVQTGPGQSLELDLDKDPNIDVSRTGNKTSIKLNIDNKNKLKKPGQAKPGQQVSIEEGPDYRLQAQRDTMNLSDQAIVELVASLYKKLDQLGHREETDAEYFTDLYKRHPNENVNEEEECSACGGTGWDRSVTSDEDERGCDECGGTGKVEVNEGDGNMEGYLATIDEYVEMLFKHKTDDLRYKAYNDEIAYRIQNAVDDIRTRELGLKPSNIRAKYNKQIESAQKKRLVDTGLDLEEGPQDKYIFKAIFMAGGPGSGKSTVADTVLKQFHLKVIDSDKMFEYLMAKKGMDVGDPEQIYSPDGQATRDHGKNLVDKQKGFWLDGKLGVVIDGTGRDINKIAEIRQEMIGLGYSTMMLYVNTKLDVAQQRNTERKRILPPEKVEQMWRAVQENIMKFQQLFGANRFIVIDNSEGLEDPKRAEAFTKVEGSLRAFLQAIPRNRIAQAWLNKNKKFGWRMH
jgi:cytidylate kinase